MLIKMCLIVNTNWNFNSIKLSMLKGQFINNVSKFSFSVLVQRLTYNVFALGKGLDLEHLSAEMLITKLTVFRQLQSKN